MRCLLESISGLMHSSLIGLIIWELSFFIVCIHGDFVANDITNPQYFSNASSINVCINRTYCNVLLDVPPKCAGVTSHCPIIMGFHGHGAHNTLFIGTAGRGFSDGVRKYNFIGVYPQGEKYPVIPVPGQDSKTGWSDGVEPGNICAWDNFTCTGDPNDTIFVSTIVSALLKMGALGRFYAFGTSNGAAMVQRLGANICPKLPFLAIGAQSGQLLSKPIRSGPNPYNYNKPRTGSAKVAQLAIHGTADPVVPYSGGPRFGSKDFSWYSEPQSDGTWAEHNGCTGTPIARNVSAAYKKGKQDYNTTAVHHIWDCPDAFPVEYYQVIDATHVSTTMLNNMKKEFVVLEFFNKVERYYSTIDSKI